MGYMHIDNLYKNVEILLFKECYALEKIHGTSANIRWKNNKLIYFSGGESYAKFILLFDNLKLIELFKEYFLDIDVEIYGEAYGGKQQGMSHTYGKELKFVVFDVKINGCWLNVPNAEEVATKLGLEFVDYKKVDATIESLNYQRDFPSVQAKRNGILECKEREGIVIRPLMELIRNDGKRIIVKHKNDSFMETKTKREINPDKLKVLEEKNAIADEWVTPMRLTHVLDKLNNPNKIEDTKKVIDAMVEDIYREGKGEIIESQDTAKAIGRKTVQLFKKKLFNNI